MTMANILLLINITMFFPSGKNNVYSSIWSRLKTSLSNKKKNKNTKEKDGPT